jgi:glutamate formiminotransferase/formiminotetrahydrofolate cyclodeaminase
VRGAFLNVQINASGLDDKEYAAQVLAEGQKMADAADAAEREILEIVHEKMK